MKVSNVRAGLATNSSSSHSIVISSDFLKNNVKDLCNDDFGWDYFVAKRPESKLKYLGILLNYQLSAELEDDALSPEVLVHVILSKYLNGVIPPENSGIDHQSIFKFPLTYGTNTIDLKFFEEFRDFILRDDVLILGGNDNGGDPENHPALQHTQYTNISPLLPFIKASYGPFWCRKDGEFWTVFDKKGLRYTFSYNDFIQPIVKYNSPLLVDLKITDYCATGCTFCYQSSTKQGKVGNFETIKGILDALAKLKVFEVAIGGGNPVSHPKFIEILEYACYLGIVPNFSTRDISFFRDKKSLNRISVAVGSFAYSIDPLTNLEKLERDIKGFMDIRKDYNDAKLMTLQVFIGPGGFNKEEELLPILKLARKYNTSVTILGFKNVGRGKDLAEEEEKKEIKIKEEKISEYQEPEYPWGLTRTLMTLDAKGQCPDIGVDTALAVSLSNTFIKEGVNHKLFVLDEGKSSCYIDAVTKIISKSSFDPDIIAIDVTDATQIETAFSKF